MNRSMIRLLGMALVLFLFCTTVACYAGNLSRRRSAARRNSRGSTRNRLKPTRRALRAPVQKYAPRSSHQGSDYDSTFKRGIRSVFNLDARGGGIHGAIGQSMASGKKNSVGRRRSAQRWSNGVGYTINAGRAAKYLGHIIGR